MSSAPLLAGAAVRDISPRTPLFLVGYPHVERVSTGVHDPLLASALCLRTPQTSVLLIALDILFIDPPTARRLRAAVSDRTGVPPDHVFVSCSHTHSGPVTLDMLSWESDPVVPHPDPGYMALLERQILDAAAAAAADRRPCQMAWTTARAQGVGSNRLTPDGVSDPEVTILAVRRAQDRRLLALSMTYSMHPTVLHEDSTLVSADFPGYARLQLQEALGTDLAVLYHTGPAGNQSPRYCVTGQTFSEAERLGRRLGEAVQAAVRAIPDTAFRDRAELGGTIVPVDLPARRMPSVEEAEHALDAARRRWEELRRTHAGHGPERTAECALFGAEEAVVLARAQAKGRLQALHERYSPAEVQVLRLGERCAVGLPAEIFVEYSLEIKRRSGGRAFAVSLVNGELQGYIVTPEGAAAGGYEAANSVFLPAAGQRMVEAALRALPAC